MPYFGEKFGISLEIVDGKLTTLRDGVFTKAVQLQENFTSVLRVELSNETYTTSPLDLNDPLLSSSNVHVSLSTGIQKKTFSQNIGMGARKIELLQGVEIGQAVIRVSHSIERAMKWQIELPFEKNENLVNSIILAQDIEIIIQSDESIKYEDDQLIFSIQGGFSQILFFIKSRIPYERLAKNLLLITKGDQTMSAVTEISGDQKFFPVISYVFLQDFKNKIERYEDLHEIGSILALRGKNSDAINYLNKALTAVRSIGDQSKEAEILMTLANVEVNNGDFQKAASNFNYALKIIEEYQNEPLRLGCLLSLSKTLKKLKRFQDALDYQYSILEFFQERQDRLGEAEILVDISDSLMGLGRIDEAVDYQQAAVDVRRQIHDQVGEANNLMVFGELLIRAARVGEAMGCYEQALRIKRTLGDDKGVAECLKSMGMSFYKIGKYEKARTYYDKAKESFQNQALIMEVQEIDRMLEKMKEHPFPECEICVHKCTPDLIGITYSEATDPSFSSTFTQILRESLANKNMDKLVDLLEESATQNMDLKSKGISHEIYEFCLMMQASNLHLSQLSIEQKKQILTMIQENIRKRKYSKLNL